MKTTMIFINNSNDNMHNNDKSDKNKNNNNNNYNSSSNYVGLKEMLRWSLNDQKGCTK